MMTEDEDYAPDGLNLAERIRRLANGRTTLDVAQFQFIGLADVRACYAERWPERRDRVQRVAREFISKRLAGDDVLIPGADGFLVVFGACTGQAADMAALRITKELNAFFVGSGDEDLQFKSQRKAMSVDDLAKAFGDLLVETAPGPAPAQARPAPPAQASRHGLDVGSLTFLSRPVWDARHEALTTSLLIPADQATGEPVNDHVFDQPGEMARSRVELDELQLRESETALRKLFGSGQRAFVAVSLHAASLNSMANLTRLFAVMSTFDKQLMRYRIIRVTGIEPGFPRIYLEDIVRTLKARAPSIALALHWNEPDVASALRLKPMAIGFDLPQHAFWPSGPRIDVLARIHAACELARAAATPVFVDGEIPPDLAMRLIADGVSLIASPQIWPLAPAPHGVQKWPLARLEALAPPASAA